MSRCLSAIVSACLAAAVVAAPANDEKKSAAVDAARLVQQLGSSKHAERESAAKALDALGAAALSALREGAKSADPEIRRRAGDLVSKLERQAESAAAMAPSKVHLKATDAPMAEVVRDLGKQANVRFQIAREPVDLAARHVTVDTGEVSFWEALDALCRAAKVSLRPSTFDPSAGDTGNAAVNAALGALPGGMVQLNAAGAVFITSASSSPTEEPLVLQDGALPAYPTAILGAARVRLIPDRWANRDRKPGDEVRWTLEVLTEPKLRWVTQPSVRLDGKQGVRVDTTPQAGADVAAPRAAARAIALGGGGIIGQAVAAARGVTRYEIPIYVKADAGVAISELKGSLAGPVQAAAGAVATIADVTKDKASAATKDGTTITVKDYSRADDGTVTMTLDLERQMGGIAFGGGIAIGGAVPNRAVRRPGGLIPPQIARNVAGADGMLESVKLLDDKGRPYEMSMTKSETASRNGAITGSLTFECQPPAADAKPGKLEIHGPRSIAVETSFTLRDVPAVQ
jgi:hypothetical protein